VTRTLSGETGVEYLISDQMCHGNLRSPVAARGNHCLIVNFHDGGAIRLDEGKVLGVFPGFVDHVSVGWIGLGEEIPFAKGGEPISKRQPGGKST
jgi:hypothetical protein